MTIPPVSPDSAATVAAPSASHRITPRALLDTKRISSPKLHPDGHRVAFVVAEADFEDSRFVSHIWITEWVSPLLSEESDLASPAVNASEVEPDSTPEKQPEEDEEDRTRQLTFSHEGEREPKWSPDGRYLAFLSSRYDPTEPESEDDDDDPTEQIWLLPIDGGEAHALTNAREGILDYEWTPDGREIIYLAPEPRVSPLESVRKDERNRRKIDPTVEHDDRLRRQFWRIGIHSSSPKLLFTSDCGTQEFALSPDGERFCYATNYSGDDNDYHLVDLFVCSISERSAVKLVERAGGKYQPRWSPDGSKIAFLSWLDPSLSYSRECIFTAAVPLAGAVPAPAILVTDEAFDYDVSDLHWDAEQNTLVALALVGVGSRIIRIDKQTVIEEVVGDDCAVNRKHLDIESGGSALVWVQESAAALEEVYLRDSEGAVHALTELNADFGKHHKIPRQEVVHWQSPDGTQIEGVLTYPLAYEEGKRVPLIVQVHGGPKGRATQTLRAYAMPAVWSAEGYAVLQPNFRGSEGYGHAFSIANRRDLGGGDFADIMAGVDWCIEQGLADPDRLGIMGGSYGGYMTNWAIGQTDRFRGAVSMFGIFHLQTDYSNSELSRWDNDYLGAYYWEDPEIYRKLSPGSFVDRIKTPTLIIHGDDDSNTFISNSKELYQALRHRGVTTQFVHYPREGHGLSEPNHKLDEMRRCLAWMDRHVKHHGAPATVYRLGDKVPHSDGVFDMVVSRADPGIFLGEHGKSAGEAVKTVFLEVAVTISDREARLDASAITFGTDSFSLEPVLPEGKQGEALRPIGIPVEVVGGKILIVGENLRCVQHPHDITGRVAFGFSVVFLVPRAGGDYLLHVSGFPPVAVLWTEDEADEITAAPTSLPSPPTVSP